MGQRLRKHKNPRRDARDFIISHGTGISLFEAKYLLIRLREEFPLKTFWEFIKNLESEANKIIREIDEPFVLYRGVADTSYPLSPGLFRTNKRKLEIIECNLFNDFCTRGELFLSPKVHPSNINILAQMQHSGVPTRLLDWTKNLSTAIFFALRSISTTSNPCIWLLDPYKLNKRALGIDNELPDSSMISYCPDDDEIRYHKKPEGEGILFEKPITIIPPMLSSRMFAQEAHFTIHGICKDSLEQQCPDCVQQFPIPKEFIADAQLFLRHAGQNEYKLFPDLDGLARQLVIEYGLK